MVEENILTNLRKNSRLSILKLSNELNIPASTLANRIRSLEKKNIILKHTSLIDFSKAGYNSVVKIILKVRKDRLAVKKFLINHKCVNSLSELGSDYDFLIEAIHKDSLEFKDFVDDLEKRFKIKDKKIFPIIKDLKRESFMSGESK